MGTIPLHAVVLRRRPEDLGLTPDGGHLSQPQHSVEWVAAQGVSARTALRDAAFWWLSAAFFLSQLATAAVAVHLVPYLIDHGYEPGFAAVTAGLIGVMALPGRLIFTPLGDRLSRSHVTACLFLVQSIALLVLLLIHSVAGVYSFVVLFGLGFGAMTPARAALIADLYGPAHYGQINAVLALFVTGSRALAPVGAGAVYDWSGSYDPVLWGLLVTSIIATTAILLVRRNEPSGTSGCYQEL
jgi:MFS family permease